MNDFTTSQKPFLPFTSLHWSLALFDFVSRSTVVAQGSVFRKLRFLGNRCIWIQAQFCGQLPHHISKTFLFLIQNFSIFNFFTIFVSFSLTWDSMGANISKRYSSFHPIWANLYENKVVMGEYKVMGIWRSAKNFKFCGTLKFLLTH